MSDQIYFFDTTLRDGEQCPGASMNLREKLEVARQMERLGMDVIEAGFPCISDGDFEAVHTIAREIKKCRIAGLARCVKADIEAAARALEPAGERARIHIFLATSKLHMQFKLKKAESEILRMAAEGVSYAKQFVQDVEFSPEDASRTDLDFLTKVVETVIDAGATTVNIPDTVGYTTPDEFYRIIRHLKENVPNIGKAVISVHCHNDLGLAVANSLAAVRAGARQVEGTINGIGERAGNVALEEVIMALRTRAGQFGDVTDNINTKEIVRTSRIVARMSGMQVQRSKAIVGENAFAHSSGIHQHGILNCRETYEVMDPQAVGWGATELPLTKHSGALPSNPGWNSWAMSSRKRKSTPSLNASRKWATPKNSFMMMIFPPLWTTPCMPPPAYGNWTSCNSWRAATRVPRLRWDCSRKARNLKTALQATAPWMPSSRLLSASLSAKAR